MVVSPEPLLPTGIGIGIGIGTENVDPSRAGSDASSSGVEDGVLFQSRFSLLVPVLVPRALAQLALSMNQVILPLEVLSLGHSYDAVGYVLATGGAGVFCGNYPSGRLSARHGTRMVAVGSFVGLLLGAAVCASARGALALAAGAFVVGVSDASEVVSRQSYVTAAADPQILGRLLSTLAATKRVGYALGPMLAGFIGRRHGFPAAYWAMCGVSFVGLLWTAVFMRPVTSKSNSKSADRGTGGANCGHSGDAHATTAVVKVNSSDFHIAGIIRRHWRKLLTVQVFVTALSFLRTARNLLLTMVGRAAQLGVGEIGDLMSLSYTVDGLLFPMAGWLLDSAGRSTTAALCTASYAVAMASLVGGTAFWVAAFAGLSGIANGLSNGIVMTIGSDMAPPEAREPFIGIFRTLARCAELLGPLVVGSLAEHLSLTSAVLTSVAVALVGSIWSLCCMRTRTVELQG